MNLQNIIADKEQKDPEVFDKLSDRRKAMKSFSNFAGKVALASLPFAFGSMLKKAYGQTPSDIVGVLNFALTLEYLESEFYKLGVAAPGLILAVAQTFEDTGVRAYKGQAPNLMSNNDVLTAALNIHSVEARHASHIRYMRRARQAANPGNGLYVGDIKPWITLNKSNIGSALVQASYDGEEATMQAGVNILNVGNQTFTENAASEAFDEPLTKAQILAIVDPFII